MVSVNDEPNGSTLYAGSCAVTVVHNANFEEEKLRMGRFLRDFELCSHAIAVKNIDFLIKVNR